MNNPFISLAVIIISIAFAFFYVLPQYNESVKHRKDIESLEKTLNNSKEIKTLIADTKESLASVEGERKARFEKLLPEKIDPVRFANDIQAMGRKHRIVLSGIKIDSSLDDTVVKSEASNATTTGALGKILSIGGRISQSEGVDGGTKNTAPASKSDKKYVATGASFSFTTTYETFQLFLDDIEKSLGLIEVKSLSFSPGTADTNSKDSKVSAQPVYQFTMAIETYSLK